MKGLKFRVWDKEREYYLDETELAGITSDGKYILYIEEEEISKLEIEGGYILEQYTGLKDKNGKEIFIGDIVSEHNGDIIGKIIQKPSGEYCIAWIGIYAGSSILYDELSMCEVIGNIHESNMREE